MTVEQCMDVVYADDGMIGSRDPEWIQGAINVFNGLFRGVGVMANVSKSNNINCQTGEIHTKMSEE